ncbi:uncharacterized protein LOC131607525 [Vicia villosa]|uniref:uncharacterized protein LOC131607525 n=1 Tax=Vicia villosa TaxID=3911 RepID=UPI00273CB896|nr:uncharacterized protein LOC131607525 [Vicia villosa]
MISWDPLFSCIVTFCILILFYLPHLFSKIVLSPVIILTAVLLFTILRIGAIQKIQHEQKENQQKHDESVKEENRARKCREEKEKQRLETEVNSEMGLEKSLCFVEWNVRAPLEVIYEEYDEGEEKWDDSNEREENWNKGVSNYASLNRYFPESDSDSSSESGSPTIEEWDEEDGEGLIEIALDGRKGMKMDLEFQCEEENLIEIDIFPTRYGEFSGDSYR